LEIGWNLSTKINHAGIALQRQFNFSKKYLSYMPAAIAGHALSFTPACDV